MHDRYLQHVFRWTTKAGSFECSSFVRLKPAAPSKSMAVWGIMAAARGGGVQLSPRLGCGSRWYRGLWQRAQRRSCWRSGMRDTCASARKRCRAGSAQRHAEMPSLVCVFFGLLRRPPALRWRIRSGRKAFSGPLRRRRVPAPRMCRVSPALWSQPKRA